VKILSLCAAVVLLTGCVNFEEREKECERKYSSFSCGELNGEYDNILSHRDKQFQERITDNTNKTIYKAISGIIDRTGNAEFDSESDSEKICEIHLKVLRKFMLKKKCHECESHQSEK
jgi:hypothetical protein